MSLFFQRVSCVLACQSGCDVRHVVLVSQPALMSATLDLLHQENVDFNMSRWGFLSFFKIKMYYANSADVCLTPQS
jgi:hypothetical protein